MPSLDPETGKPLSGAQKRARAAQKAADAAKATAAADGSWADVYFDVFSKTGSKKRAAEAAGVTLGEVRKREADDPEFKERFGHAVDDLVEFLEGSLLKMALDKNNPLPLFGLLKRWAPATWNEKLQIDGVVKHQIDQPPVPVAEL